MQPGTILGKRYRIVDRIGGGGMALVYRGEDTTLGRPVALKLLRSQHVADPDFVRRFRREAQAAASLSHPNIVSIYDVGQEGDLHYIVMELVQGQTLKSRIQQEGPLPVGEVARIGLEILAALEHAHSHKIVHRDIKPHNILLAPDGRVKVTDFGIARAVTTDTVSNTGSIMGSAHYFSPEMARGRGGTVQSDLYSFGVVLYEMVTGRVPFQGDSPISVALKHLQEEVLPPSALNPEVPAELEGIILRLLEKDPDHRYASAEEVRRALYRFLEDYRAGRTQVVDRDYPTLDFRAIRERQWAEQRAQEEESVAKKPRRRRTGLYLFLLFLLLLFGGLGYAGYYVWQLFDIPSVQVPSVVGKPASEADRILEAQGLRMQVQNQEYSLTVPAGAVSWQEFEPGQVVKQGREVGVRISLGPRMVLVPNVRNMTREEAEDALIRAGLRVGAVTDVFARDVPEGRVAEQNPVPGAQVRESAVVDLKISRGTRQVPNLIGSKLEEAAEALAEFGLAVGDITRVPNPQPKDTVIGQDPLPQTEVPPETRVNLTVSEGTATLPVQETSVAIAVTAQAPDDRGYVNVRVLQIDASGTSVAHEALHLVGEAFTLPVRWRGATATLQVFINGTLSDEITVGEPPPAEGAAGTTEGASGGGAAAPADSSTDSTGTGAGASTDPATGSQGGGT